jgi:hypothetical protein
MTRFTTFAVTVGIFAIVAGSPALASGGKTAGGGTTPTGGGGTGTGGGGGGGGGGGSRAGINDVVVPAPAPVPQPPAGPPCATFTNISAPVGYYLTWAAVWNTYTVLGCSPGSHSVNVQVTETNTATGLVDYDVTMSHVLTGNQNASMVLDNDFAPFNTDYRVTMTATDAGTGAVLDTQSLTVTTPAPR